MKQDDMQEFFEIWASYAEVYGKTVPENALVLTFGLLSEFALDDIKVALKKHALDPSSGKFMPRPADIAQKIGGEIPGSAEIIGLARSINTPLGCFCRMKIGKWDLDNQSSFYLQQRAEEVKSLIPDFVERARSGRYTDHEIRLMKLHNVNLASELCPGLPGPPKEFASMIASRAKALPAFVPTDRSYAPTERVSVDLHLENLADEVKS